MDLLTRQAKRYLNEIGLPVTGPDPWPGAGQLPYFMQDAFDFSVVEIANKPVLLAAAKEPNPPAQIERLIERIRDLIKIPSLYVAETMTSYDRKRLIDRGVSFLVPDKQVFILPLGLDLRETNRGNNANTGGEPKRLSPSTQALLFAALLRPSPGRKPEWRPADLAGALGYTPMTASRAVGELVGAGLVEQVKVGNKPQMAIFLHDYRKTWEKALPTLRSPVLRTTWTDTLPPGVTPKLAGLPALSEHSMLAAPRRRVFAVDRHVLPAVRKRQVELEHPGPNDDEIQVWSYTPDINPGDFTVDPLSLYMSLRDETDERVQTALDELVETLGTRRIRSA